MCLLGVGGMFRGAPRRIRTAGLSLRRGPLYPTELSGQVAHFIIAPSSWTVDMNRLYILNLWSSLIDTFRVYFSNRAAVINEI